MNHEDTKDTKENSLATIVYQALRVLRAFVVHKLSSAA